MSVDDFLSAETRRIIAAGVGAPEPLPRVVPLTTPEPAAFRPEEWATHFQEMVARVYGLTLDDLGLGAQYEHAHHLQLDIYNLECDYCTGKATP